MTTKKPSLRGPQGPRQSLRLHTAQRVLDPVVKPQDDMLLCFTLHPWAKDISPLLLLQSCLNQRQQIKRHLSGPGLKGGACLQNQTYLFAMRVVQFG
jgi:hypothetical protein